MHTDFRKRIYTDIVKADTTKELYRLQNIIKDIPEIEQNSVFSRSGKLEAHLKIYALKSKIAKKLNQISCSRYKDLKKTSIELKKKKENQLQQRFANFEALIFPDVPKR